MVKMLFKESEYYIIMKKIHFLCFDHIFKCFFQEEINIAWHCLAAPSQLSYMYLINYYKLDLILGYLRQYVPYFPHKNLERGERGKGEGKKK